MKDEGTSAVHIYGIFTVYRVTLPYRTLRSKEGGYELGVEQSYLLAFFASHSTSHTQRSAEGVDHGMCRTV